MNLDLWALGLFAVLALSLRRRNYPESQRYRQWWAPLLALLFAVVMTTTWARLPEWSLDDLVLLVAEAIGAVDSAVSGVDLTDVDIAELLRQTWADVRESQPWFRFVEPILLALAVVVRNVLRALLQNLDLAALLLFFLAKDVGRTVGRWRSRRLGGMARAFYRDSDDSGSDGSSDGNARRQPRSVGLKPHFLLSRRLFSVLAWVAFGATLAQVSGLLGDASLGFGPGYTALSFLLLAEIAWFLGGPLAAVPLSREEAVAASSPAEADDLDIAGLVAYYRDTWPDWLLAEGHYVHEAAPVRSELGPCGLAGDTRSNACCLMLDELLAGGSVLAEDVLPEQVAPCLAYFLRDRVERGSAPLLLVEREDQIDPTRRWIQHHLGETLRVSDWHDALDGDPHLVVTTLQHDVVRLLGRPWATRCDVLVVFDTQAVVLWRAAEADALVQALADRSGHPPQLLGFGDWRVNAEAAVRNILGLAVREIQFDANADAHYLVWRLEPPPPSSSGPSSGSSPSFAEPLLGRTQTPLAPDVILAQVALDHARNRLGSADNNSADNSTDNRADSVRITLTGQQALPWEESLEEVDNVTRLRLGRPGDGLARTDVVESDWAFGQQGEQARLLVARDHAANLPATLRRWLDVSTGLVQIVVPPYRLRDHFVAELRDHLGNRRRFSALAPGYSRSRWRQVYALYRRLERGFVSVRLIRETLGAIDVSGDMAGELRALFRDWLELETRLETRRVVSYRPDQGSVGTFVVETELRIRPDRRERRPYWHQVVAVRTVEKDARSRKVVARYYRGEVQQQLLPGQVHAFGGQAYRIEPYDPGDDAITAYWVDLRGAHNDYEQVRRYSLDWSQAVREPSYQRVPLGGGWGRLERVEIPIDAITLGYVANAYGSPARTTTATTAATTTPPDYRPLPEPLRRHYRHGKLLALYADLPESSCEHLADLLNDAFVSYYPEAHPFLRAAVTVSDGENDDGDDQNSGHHNRDDARGNGRDDRAVPSLLPLVSHRNFSGDNPPGSAVTAPPVLCFIADTPFDLGLVESLEENLASILGELGDAVGALTD
ncbi:MAG: hypothetical protein U5L04_16525 [Trueperaceae bacterium]|nr:hypothetical protein [Trueperaceae bacterium]